MLRELRTYKLQPRKASEVVRVGGKQRITMLDCLGSDPEIVVTWTRRAARVFDGCREYAERRSGRP